MIESDPPFVETESIADERTRSVLSEAEIILRERFLKERGGRALPSSAKPLSPSERVETLVLPDELRAKMPLTKSKYLAKENPHLVQWEREVRKFLRNLTPEQEHRVSAVMVYEWATGIRVADIMQTENKRKPGEAWAPTWRVDLRRIDKILNYYYGKPYMTYIAGHKVPKAYKVKRGYYITRHRPMTLTLWTEYQEGVLYP